MATAGGGGSGGSGSGSGGSGSGSGGGGGGGSSGGGGGNLNDQKLAQFISITGAAEDVAKHYLEVTTVAKSNYLIKQTKASLLLPHTEYRRKTVFWAVCISQVLGISCASR